ncbi:tetratricopeptide repeat protein [Vreelandella songnenensis]|uniref:Tetratricopeptide repeat protein n=1 Tax=Vreelandella songnenensis TaxID=1176243 RepID=A0A2T0V7D0_9GAMM|nr:tetratricopeptide repeat protein [Halomonas songnenensis]PRY66054.1 tetratricopeptide repeat protein [Halomonas songnenensis]
MQRLGGVLLFSLWASLAHASAPLSGDIIGDLRAMQTQLAEGAYDSVATRGAAQAERLAGGNASDRWASALYHQLAAGALARMEQPVAAADHLAKARQTRGVEAEQTMRWLKEEASLRRAAGQNDQAIALLSEWLASEQDPDVQWQLVRLLADEGEWEDAAERLEQAMAQVEKPSESQQALALVVLRRAGQGEQALGWLVEGLNRESDAEAWRQAAGLAQQAGQPGVAAGLWDTAWQLGKLEAPEDFWLLIELHRAGGTPARAAERLEQALERGDIERDERALRLLATSWQQARHVNHALSAWKTLAEHTQNAADWRQYGQLAYAWGEETQAEAALLEAARLGDEQASQWLARFD